MNNKIIIESLSMDLLRIALGYQRGSIKMASRFTVEAQNRINEINTSQITPSFARVIKKLPLALSQKDTNDIAEDALMYHTLCKNYAKHFC